MGRPPRQQRLQDAGERRLADRDRSGDADHVRDTRRDRPEEGRRHALQVLGGADVQVEQPAQRQVDGDDLVDVDPLVDALQRVEVLLTERERRRRSQVGPLVAIEREVPIGHVENLRSARGTHDKRLASCSAPGTRRRSSSTPSSTTCCAASGPSVVAPCACSIRRAATDASCSRSPNGSPSTGIAAELTGCDVDGAALRCDRRAGAHDRGRRARLTTGRDATFDIVVGNPPFLSQMAAATTRGGASSARRWAVRRRRGRVPGARRAAGAARRRSRRARAAAVDRRGTRRGAGARRRSPAWPISRGRGGNRASVTSTPPSTSARWASSGRRAGDRRPVDDVWTRVVTDRLGIPALDRHRLACAGTLGERAEINANFRDEYYALVPAVHEGGDGPPLVTSGLIDPGVCLWGRRPMTFARADVHAPACRPRRNSRVASRDGRNASWSRRCSSPTRPGSSRRSPTGDGAWLPGVPVNTVTPTDGATTVEEIAAVLTSPVASVLAWQLGGRHRPVDDDRAGRPAVARPPAMAGR